jgi:hypothetical protein
MNTVLATPTFLSFQPTVGAQHAAPVLVSFRATEAREESLLR